MKRKIILLSFIIVSSTFSSTVISCDRYPEEKFKNAISFPESLKNFVYDIKSNGLITIESLVKSLNESKKSNYSFVVKNDSTLIKDELFYVNNLVTYDDSFQYAVESASEHDKVRSVQHGKFSYKIDNFDIIKINSFLKNNDLWVNKSLTDIKKYICENVWSAFVKNKEVIELLKKEENLPYISKMTLIDNSNNLLNPDILDKNYVYKKPSVIDMELNFPNICNNEIIKIQEDVKINFYDLTNIDFNLSKDFIGKTINLINFQDFCQKFFTSTFLKIKYINFLEQNHAMYLDEFINNPLLFIKDCIFNIDLNGCALKIKVSSNNDGLINFADVNNKWESFKMSCGSYSSEVKLSMIGSKDSYLRGNPKKVLINIMLCTTN